MNQSEAATQIFNRLKTQWEALEPTVLLALPNMPFTEPAPGPTVAWARGSIVWNLPQRRTIGNSTYLVFHSGTIYVQIFGPLGMGTNPNGLLAARVGQIFQGKMFGPVGNQITTRQTGIDSEGNEGRWYMSTVATPFDYHERVTN